jgi:3-deoxy-D-manno-octulosonic-acid transferase
MLLRAFYSLLMHGLRAAVWLLWRWRSRHDPAWGQRWRERRGRALPPDGAAGGLVVHAVSMGEVMAATPLVEALLAAGWHGRITVTCTTPTASALIRERFGARVHHVYLPFDTPGATRRFLHAWRPQGLLLMETELWPNLLHAASMLAVPVVLANARLSDRSARSYARWRWITHALLEPIDLVLVQSAAERQRFIDIGCAPARVQVVGNLKADLSPPPAAVVDELRLLAAGRPVLLAASTHEGEEQALIDAWRAVFGAVAAPLLVIAPRHPQRFDAVAGLLDAAGIAFVRRSSDTAANARHQVLLLDRMGEVPAWCAVAEAVFVGGSLIERGGHNPLEPAAAGRAVIAGPHVFNFQQAFDRLDAAGATLRPADAAGLAAALIQWRDAPASIAAMGVKARAVADSAVGALPATLAVLQPWLARWPARIDHHGAAWAVRYDKVRWPAAAPERFEPGWWQSQGRAEPHGSGRRPVWLVSDAKGPMVMRHYWRGGLATSVSMNRFVRAGAERSRGFREWRLLARMHALGLPVPRPVAALWRGAGLAETADLVVERIEPASDLARRLAAAPLPPGAWASVGAAIGRLHAAGAWHADLNAHNVLLDAEGRAWIVDFDRGRIRAPGAWAQANLKRLQRSLRKLQGEGPLHWDEARDWPLLVDAWRDAISAR